MDLLLISPKWEKFKHWPFHMPLLGALTVAGLTPRNHSITYIDENIQTVDFSAKPDVVVISAMTVQAQRGYEIAREFRKQGIPVIMGGLHATLLPEEVAQEATSAVAGEAEGVWEQVLLDVEKKELKPIYVNNEKVDMSCGSFSLPRRDLLRTIGYTKTMAGQRVIDTLQAGRGCARNCANCNVPMISGRRFRPRNMESLLQEIASIEAKFIFFVDDSIPECRDFFIPLFRAMKGMKKEWMSVGALHVVNDPELLQAMVESGCRTLYIGFDRLDPAWREREGKRAAHDLYRLDIKKHDINFNQDFLNYPEPYFEAIKRIQEAGIHLIGTFAFGFDTDQRDVFERSIDFALKSNIDLADFAIAVPYPRSPFAQHLEKNNRILSRDWSRYNGMHVVFKPLHMSPEELDEGALWAWQQWTRERPIFRNMIRVFGETKAKSV